MSDSQWCKDSGVLISSLERKRRNVEQLVTQAPASAGTPRGLSPQLEPSATDLICGWAELCERLAKIAEAGAKNDRATLCPPGTHNDLPQRIRMALPQTLHAVTGVIRLFGAQNNDLFLQDQENAGCADGIGGMRESSQDVSTFTDFHKERSEHLGEIRGLKDKVAHRQTHASPTVDHILDNGLRDVNVSGSNFEEPEEWKRKMRQPVVGSDAEISMLERRSKLGHEPKEWPNRCPTFELRQQNDGTAEASDGMSQLGRLQTDLYRKQIRFIFRVFEIHANARDGVSQRVSQPLPALPNSNQNAMELHETDRKPDVLAQASRQYLCLPGSIEALPVAKVCGISWILWLLLSGFTWHTLMTCQREKGLWLEANGLTRAYMLGLAHEANLDIFTTL